MKLVARASAVTDTAVIELAKRIRRKRVSLAADPIVADMVPISSGQGILRRFGLGKFDFAASSEITIAKILREWHGLDSFYTGATWYRECIRAEEKEAQVLKDFNNRIRMVEYRVFGLSPTEKYPSFSSLPQWLSWRIQTAHPEYECENTRLGWATELFEFAVQDAKLSFPSVLLG